MGSKTNHEVLGKMTDVSAEVAAKLEAIMAYVEAKGNKANPSWGDLADMNRMNKDLSGIMEWVQSCKN